MSKKKDQPVSSLHDLMEENDFSPEYRKPHRSKVVAKLLAATAVAAVAVGCLTVPVGFAVAAGGHSGIAYWDSLEEELTEDDLPLPQRTVLLDRNGKEFAQFYSENRQNVPLDSVSPVFIDALIATEDSRFYETNGFDGIAIARSFISTTSGDQKQGASGITQQLVKNFQILNAKSDEDRAKVQSRSIGTKLQELKYAINLEKEYTKEEILQMYVNTVYFGNNAYGISAAAQTYFSTTPDKLTLQQAATLVGVINNPTIYNPISAPEGSEERKNTVLYRLLVTDKITQEEHDKAVATPTEIKPGSTENGCGQSAYPYYCDLVRQEILSNPAFGPDPETRQAFLYRGGVTITTAMDPHAMDLARQAAVEAYGDENRVGTGIATIQPGTGQIMGIGQNRSWGNGAGQTEMIYAKAERQTGSSFKPFTLATALEQGIPASTQMVSNSYYTPPAGYTAPEGGFSNFGFYNYGSVDAYKATKMSMNIWYVKLMERTGVVPVAEFSNRLGLTIPTGEEEGAVNPATLSLTLGAWESSPIQMANAYATFASGGTYCNPVSILSAVRTYTGEKVPVSDPDCHQAIMPNIANTVTDVLKGPLAPDGTAPGAALAGGRQAAAKTGTTNAFADAWLVGYTPQYATAVWTGDPRGGAQYPLTEFIMYGQYRSGLSGDGATASGPLWKFVMDGMHQGLENKSFPSPSSSVGAAVTARTIPNVTGLDINEAITVLQSYGYVPVIAQETSGDAKILAKNTVVSQNPAGGSNGSHKQQVTLTLSPGSDTGMKISEKKDK